VQGVVVTALPSDLPAGAQFILLVELAEELNDSLARAYDQALRDLGSWRSVGLTLRASDGRVWQINAYVPAGETAPRPRRLVMNGRVLVRN